MGRVFCSWHQDERRTSDLMRMLKHLHTRYREKGLESDGSLSSFLAPRREINVTSHAHVRALCGLEIKVNGETDSNPHPFHLRFDSARA